MQDTKYPKNLFLTAVILSGLFFIFYTISFILFINNVKTDSFILILLIFISVYTLLKTLGLYFASKIKKRWVFSFIKNSFLTFFILGISVFFIYTSLVERFIFTSKTVIILTGYGITSLSVFIILSLKPVKRYFEAIDPKTINLQHGFLGRIMQKTGIKLKLATLFTLVLIILIAVISFIFILRQKDTIMQQTKEFCAYATEEVALKVHNYLVASDFTGQTMELDLPNMLKKYSKSIMINGFDSASIKISWHRKKFYKSFTLYKNKEDVVIQDLSPAFEQKVLSNKDGTPTSIYLTMKLVVAEDEMFKEQMKLSRLKSLIKKMKDPEIKKSFQQKISVYKKNIKKYIQEIEKLKNKISSKRFLERQKSNPNYFRFRYPIVIFGRTKNPELIKFEDNLKNELNQKFQERVEKIKNIFFDDDGKIKLRWRRNRYGLRANMRAIRRRDEYLYSKVFNARISPKAQKEYDENLDKAIKKAVENKIEKDNISPLVAVPKFVGLVLLRFDKSVLYQPIYDSAYFVITIAIIVLIAGISLIIFLALKITKPIQNLTYGVNEIKDGNLNFKIALKSRDELGYLTNEFNEMVVYLKENKEMQKFVSKETVSMIKSTAQSSSEVELGGERKTMTLFFSDIRGFTAMSETMKPEDVVQVCNDYLDLQSVIIEKCGGDIDKFVGDEIMARFSGENHIQNSIQAAIEIQKKMNEINFEREKQNLRVVQVGIGLNTGDVIVGSMGSHKRMDFTAIGDAVNLAARLCSAAEGGHILVSKVIYDNSGTFQKSFIEKEPIKVKGKVEPIKIYDIPKPN